MLGSHEPFRQPRSRFTTHSSRSARTLIGKRWKLGVAQCGTRAVGSGWLTRSKTTDVRPIQVSKRPSDPFSSSSIDGRHIPPRRPLRANLQIPPNPSRGWVTGWGQRWRDLSLSCRRVTGDSSDQMWVLLAVRAAARAVRSRPVATLQPCHDHASL